MLAQARLYRSILIALAIAHLVLIILHPFHKAGLLQVAGYLFAHVHAVHANVESGSLRDGAVGVEDIYCLQVVRLAQLIVVDVVGGGNLQTARTKLDIHIAVLDDGNHAAYQGDNHFVPAQPLVLHILGVDAHCGIAHNGLGAGGCHHSIVSAIGILVQHLAFLAGGANGIGILVGHIVAQVEQVATLVAVDYLLGAEHSLSLGIPVHHAQSAVYQPLVIEVAEDAQYAFAALLVHCKRSAVPVAAGTQAAKLLQDDASVLVCPSPSMLEKLLTCEVALLYPLCSKAVDHLGLSGDAGVVSAGHPAGILAIQACFAHQNVLDSVVEHMAHVQHTGHVWWWDDHRIRFAAIGLAAEELMAHPVLIPFALYLRGSVLRC